MANNYVVLLDRQGPVDQMTVRVEVAPQLVSQGLEGLESFRGKITHALREEILVTPHVEPCDGSCGPRCLEGCLLTEGERGGLTARPMS